MASFDNTNFFQISDDGTNTPPSTTGILTGYGSYPFVEFWTVSNTGGSAGCTITATYSGTSVSTSNNTGSSDITSYQKIIFNSGTAATGQSQTFLPPYGSTQGFIQFGFTGGTVSAGGTVAVSIIDPLTSASIPIATYTLSAIVTATQYFAVPAVSGSSISVAYTSGGAGTSTISCTYIFTKPGGSNLPLGEKTVVINTAGAGPTRIITAGTGAKSARIVSIIVGSGTAEAIDFQQGTGTNCGTGNSQLTGLTHLAVNVPWQQAFPSGGLVALPGNDVCIHLSGANQTDGTITYSQY